MKVNVTLPNADRHIHGGQAFAGNSFNGDTFAFRPASSLTTTINTGCSIRTASRVFPRPRPLDRRLPGTVTTNGRLIGPDHQFRSDRSGQPYGGGRHCRGQPPGRRHSLGQCDYDRGHRRAGPSGHVDTGGTARQLTLHAQRLPRSPRAPPRQQTDVRHRHARRRSPPRRARCGHGRLACGQPVGGPARRECRGHVDQLPILGRRHRQRGRGRVIPSASRTSRHLDARCLHARASVTGGYAATAITTSTYIGTLVQPGPTNLFAGPGSAGYFASLPAA